jgi:aliphatic nitrilase
MYNTQVFVAPDGSYLGKHQKLMPTVGERLVHALGSAETLTCKNTDFGAMSGLICGENWNPLALFALMSGQARVHIMSWPPHFAPAGRPMRERVLIISQSAAHMMSAFVVSSCAVIDEPAYDKMEVPAESRIPLNGEHRIGGSVVVAPDCSVLAGPAGGDETIVYGDLDLESCLRGKLHRDLTGHYNRPDVFQLHVNAQTPTLLTHGLSDSQPDPEIANRTPKGQGG